MIKDLSIVGFAILLSIYLLVILFNLYLFYLNLLRKRKLLPTIVLSVFAVLNFALLGFLTTTRYFMTAKENVPSYIQALENIPYWIIIVWLVIYLAFLIYADIFEFFYNRKTINRFAISKSLNELNIGLSFSFDDGNILFSNNIINDLWYNLTNDTYTNAREFWDYIIEHKIDVDSPDLSSETLPAFLGPDNKIWNAYVHDIEINGIKLKQLVAIETTKYHNLVKTLNKHNEELNEMSKRLKKCLDNISEFTKEQEVVNAKMKLHHEFGQTLLATRYYLTNVKDNNVPKDLISKWHYNIKLLKEANANTPTTSTLEELNEAAKSVGIEIVINGNIPNDQNISSLIYVVAAESLINAVKHAEATKLYINIQEGKNEYLVEITNNGRTPDEDIVEGGGLASIRKQVEEYGGNVKVISTPEFKIEISIPGKGED